MFYDCIVVGAGPAGSTAAKILSQCGYKVLIIDSKAFPRVKLCGGCVSAKIIDYIPNIGDLSEKIAFKAILSYKKSACLSIESTEPFAYFVDRKVFDNYLLESAVKSGCKFENEKLIALSYDDTMIEVYTSKNHYKSKYLIGADGANSTVRKILHIKPKFTIKTLQGKSNTLIDYINVDIGFGKINYYWSFPQNQACGIASPKKNINKLFYKYYKTDDVFDVKGYFIPIAFSKNNLGKSNILLVGDAACLADPFSLEGIYNAIYSAHLAAASILSFPKNPYEAYVCLASKILEGNKYSYYISQIVAKFPYFVFSKLSKGNESVLADYLKGAKSSKDLFWLLLKNLYKKTIK
ncbi:Geranylgeranyl diphosphate reductase [Desulfurella amilsii]|uniref:Geranylgeranyl diphosphate reductase n=1 Tax=Desulfurella amilsii TaxID=1562698 RepID=A0A1X4XVC2_9BACT|nr:geranylgeranyl reductase family protein [Desulfurella amilsii]OSS41458.1 Geranylgeranyl diphosphate reductase [Desulfurella amilsii]